MKVALEHCDENGVEQCYDKGHGALRLQQSWSIFMTEPWSIVMPSVMEHCDDRGQGALW